MIHNPDFAMTSQFEYGSVSSTEEVQRLGEILAQCFNGSISEGQFYTDIIGRENFRRIRRTGEVAGGLAILQMGQWFGRECVPMAGIASVGISPEYRGTGVAAELLTQMLKELHANGVPLSALYASTQRLYRKVGYEQAGTSCDWELPIESIGVSVSREIRDIPIVRVSPSPEVFQNLYDQQAIQNNGNLKRNPALWQLRIQAPQEQAVFAYLIGSETQPEGYVIFNQHATASDYDLQIRDWVALTPAAVRRLWMFITDHRSLADKVIWRSRALEPFLLLLPEQTPHLRSLKRWLLRVVDLPKALEKRGYPAGVEAELHLDVRDDLLLENNGQFVLSVSGGRGEVTRGGRGELQLNIRALAPLYTGLFTPDQLQLTGQIEASDSALSVATQLFSGSEPWMSDRF